jgi:hypothetical protein
VTTYQSVPVTAYATGVAGSFAAGASSQVVGAAAAPAAVPFVAPAPAAGLFGVSSAFAAQGLSDSDLRLLHVLRGLAAQADSKMSALGNGSDKGQAAAAGQTDIYNRFLDLERRLTTLSERVKDTLQDHSQTLDDHENRLQDLEKKGGKGKKPDDKTPEKLKVEPNRGGPG